VSDECVGVTGDVTPVGGAFSVNSKLKDAGGLGVALVQKHILEYLLATLSSLHPRKVIFSRYSVLQKLVLRLLVLYRALESVSSEHLLNLCFVVVVV